MNPINAQINKELFKVIEPGKCWHEFQGISNTCKKCNTHMLMFWNPDYFTEKGFFVLWKWAIKQDWWIDFLHPIDEGSESASRVINKIEKILEYPNISTNKISYKTFARDVYEFLKKEELTND